MALVLDGLDWWAYLNIYACNVFCIQLDWRLTPSRKGLISGDISVGQI